MFFNDFFYSVFAKSSDRTESTDNSVQTHILSMILCATEKFETLISLDPNKDSGIDNISPKILKSCALPLSDPIYS